MAERTGGQGKERIGFLRDFTENLPAAVKTAPPIRKYGISASVSPPFLNRSLRRVR